MNTGFFTIATSNNQGLVTAKTGDLLIYTESEQQRILVACGSNKIPAMMISSNDVEIANISFDTLVADTVDTNNIVSTNLNIETNQFILKTQNFDIVSQSNQPWLSINPLGNIGVGISNPMDILHVNGNIRTSSGTVGPIIQVIPPITYIDLSHNDVFAIDNNIEPGNPGESRNFISGLSMLGTDASGEMIEWGKIRFIFRGVIMADKNTCALANLNVLRYNSNVYSNVTSFTVTNDGIEKGYKFIISPWIDFNINDTHYAIRHEATDNLSQLRIGSVNVQFASTYVV